MQACWLALGGRGWSGLESVVPVFGMGSSGQEFEDMSDAILRLAIPANGGQQKKR